jgi:hypothetical protein
MVKKTPTPAMAMPKVSLFSKINLMTICTVCPPRLVEKFAAVEILSQALSRLGAFVELADIDVPLAMGCGGSLALRRVCDLRPARLAFQTIEWASVDPQLRHGDMAHPKQPGNRPCALPLSQASGRLFALVVVECRWTAAVDPARLGGPERLDGLVEPRPSPHRLARRLVLKSSDRSLPGVARPVAGRGSAPQC